MLHTAYESSVTKLQQIKRRGWSGLGKRFPISAVFVSYLVLCILSYTRFTKKEEKKVNNL